MDKEIEELFVREVEVGVATLDVSTDEGTTSTRAVVQRTNAYDCKTGEERELLLVYDAADVTAVAETLRKASERAFADRS
jgi:hypothetical protein